MVDQILMKEVVAIIDRRTSLICLHANGQIKPVSEPFVTLVGSFDSPPFHAHCRSIVQPWQPGYVSTARAASAAELKTRSPSQKRKAGPHPPADPRNPPDEAARRREDARQARVEAKRGRLLDLAKQAGIPTKV